MPEFGSDRMWGLKELALPEPASWHPATAGWLGVAVILLAILAWLGWRSFRAWQREGYRRYALRRIEAMRDAKSTLTELPQVLRSTALAVYPRHQVASLYGVDWVSWLNQHGDDRGVRFLPADAEWLDRLPYETRAVGHLPADVAAHLLDASHAWVRSQRARV